MAFVCLFTVFTILTPTKEEAASAYKVTKIYDIFGMYTSNFNKDISQFRDSIPQVSQGKLKQYFKKPPNYGRWLITSGHSPVYVVFRRTAFTSYNFISSQKA